MPPRRSTRSAAASEEPAPAPPVKRRGTRVKQEPVEEPLQETADAEEQDEEEGKPTSKRRGSAKPSTAKRAASAPKRASSRSKVVKPEPVEEDAAEEEEEEEEEEPPKKTSSGRSKRVTPAPKGKASKRARRSLDPEEEEESDGTVRANGEAADEDFEDDEPASRAKPKARATTATSNGRRSTTAAGRSSRAGSSKLLQPAVTPKARKSSADESRIEEEDPDDLPNFNQSPTRPRVPPTPKAAPPPAEAEEESEEEDLLAAIRSVPPTPAGGRRLSVPPPSLKPGDTSQRPETPTLNAVPEAKVEEAPKGPQTRLVIHKLVLLNFKSYAGRQEIGPFHKSFSAIVGPNGSGKSNTIDALLFVFGYRASKMRQGKLSELIHNSADYPDLDECRVEVWFREIEDLPGPDAYKVVPDSKLAVARSAFRNNSSIYTINGNRSNFTEVTTLLKDRGIDLDHKRFLILQGEVESIAQMKPKAPNEHEDGLLEYLEDIIGTSKYKEPIDETLVQVDQLNEERSEKMNRLRVIEKDKAGLEEKKKEAEAWLRNKNELARAQNKMYQYYMLGHSRNEQELQGSIDALTQQLQQEKDKNKDTIAAIEELQHAYDERVKAFEVVKKETAPLVKQLQALEKQEVTLQEKRKHIMAKGKKLTKTLKEDHSARAEAERLIENHTESVEKHRKQVEQLETSLESEEAELEKITEALKDKTQGFHAQIEAKQKELEPWNAKINKKQAELDLATNERNMLAEKAEAIQTSVDDAVKLVEDLTGEKRAKEEQLGQLKSELVALKKELTAGEKKLQGMEEQEQKLRSKSSSARQKTDEAKASQAANTSANAVLESLNRMKATGRITGFHGRLGDLGTIPDKYDIAMSTACPALNHLVVDQVKQGEACIAYLKAQNIGRANIYVLDKLGKNIPSVNTPENAPRLFDLVKPKDPKFAPAFYKAVRDTLVAENLEQANRLAFGGQRRWRVVTLAGQLIDTSGTMSGGGTKVMKGLMSSKFAAESVRPEVLRQYEQEAEEAVRALDEYLKEKRAFAGELEELQKRIPQVEMTISKVELDIKGGEKRINDARARLKELQSQNKPDAGDVKRIAILDREIASAGDEVSKLRKQANSIQVVIEGLQNKILEIGGTRLRSQKAKVDGIKEMIDLANEQITKAEVGKAKAEKDVEKYGHTIQVAETQLGEMKAEVDELDNVLAACQEDMAGVREKVEMAQEVAEKHSEELEEMKSELDEKQALINKFRQKEMAIKQKLDDNGKAIHEERRQVKSLQERLGKLALDDVDEEDEEDEGGEPANSNAAEESVKKETASPPPQKANPYELKHYTEDELDEMDHETLKFEVAKYEGLVGEGQPNMKALEEYRKREADFLKRVKDLDEVTAQRDAMKKRYDDLRKTRLEEFMSGFNTISSKLKEMYQMITLGGNAELELVDSMDPFSEGIIFSVMPPKKSWKNISNLSGGEKTLSSLALVFALHVFKPTPLYFMDEIDAALDFRNVSIVANYIKDRTKNAQFIIISLRNDMFELSHRLIGIYKTSNATRSISIDNKPLAAAKK